MLQPAATSVTTSHALTVGAPGGTVENLDIPEGFAALLALGLPTARQGEALPGAKPAAPAALPRQDGKASGNPTGKLLPVALPDGKAPTAEALVGLDIQIGSSPEADPDAAHGEAIAAPALPIMAISAGQPTAPVPAPAEEPDQPRRPSATPARPAAPAANPAGIAATPEQPGGLARVQHADAGARMATSSPPHMTPAADADEPASPPKATSAATPAIPATPKPMGPAAQPAIGLTVGIKSTHPQAIHSQAVPAIPAIPSSKAAKDAPAADDLDPSAAPTTAKPSSKDVRAAVIRIDQPAKAHEKPAAETMMARLSVNAPIAQAASAAPVLATPVITSTSGGVPASAAPAGAAPVANPRAADAVAVVNSTHGHAATPELDTPSAIQPAAGDLQPVLAPRETQQMSQSGANPPAVTPVTSAQAAGHDFATLVDRLVEAREAAMPQVVRASISHADFGQVSLNFRADDARLTVAMNSADPDFLPAVHAAAAMQSGTSTDNGTAGQRHEAQANQQTASNSGNSTGQPQAQSQGAARGGDREQAETARRPGNPEQPHETERHARPDRRNGIYA